MFPVSYPTRSADFLSSNTNFHANGSHSTAHSNGDSRPLSVIIVGAGLGGLAAAVAISRAGHKVTVFEAAAKLDEVGAGINITPNSSRTLLRWGFAKAIAGRAAEPTGIAFRRWEDGKRIGLTNLVPSFRDWFNAPYYVVHRAHFLDAMHKLALWHGVEVVVNSRVSSLDLEAPSVTIERTGAVHHADLIIGADGIKSTIRNEILVAPPALQPSGFAAYRATVPVESMRKDPALLDIISHPTLDIWIGPGRHIVGYMIADQSTYNLVLSHPETTDPDTWDQSHAVEDMLQNFAGWDPVITRVLRLVTTAKKWALQTLPPLDTWIGSSGKVALMGDAAHPMLPYMSQGAAQAVEDAAVLGSCLSAVTHSTDVPGALNTYQSLRKTRATQVQEASRLNGIIWHYPDGPLQEARDRGSRAECEGRHFITSSNQWSDPTTQLWLYEYDGERAVYDEWERMRNAAEHGKVGRKAFGNGTRNSTGIDD